MKPGDLVVTQPRHDACYDSYTLWKDLEHYGGDDVNVGEVGIYITDSPHMLYVLCLFGGRLGWIVKTALKTDEPPRWGTTR
jgi:hypothetical protein